MVLVRNEDIDIGTSDVTDLNILQISERHTDITVYYLSNQWGIWLAQYTRTLNNATQMFLHSTVLPFNTRYRMDRVFTRKTMQCQWMCDTMNGGLKSIDDKQFAQVFSNNVYFSKVYPTDSKRNPGYALKLFCQELYVLYKMIFDGYKEQSCKGTTFMKEVHRWMNCDSKCGSRSLW